MSRTGLIVGTIVVGLLGVGIWCLLLWPSAQPKSSSGVLVTSSQRVVSQTSITSPVPSVTVEPSTFESLRQKFFSAYRTPIAFYGRVIDQHGVAVPQADVKLVANDKPLGGGPLSEYHRVTDDRGLFEIENIVGLTLAVAVSKSGYLTIPQVNSRKVTSSSSFAYGLNSAGGPHRPDRNAPVIFTLHRQGAIEPLEKIGRKNFRIARNGEPLSVAVDTQGIHQVTLRCWNQEFQRPAGQRKYDWRLEVTVPKGELQVRDNAFAFEAPATGYVPSDTINMPASMPRWDSHAERSYFIHFFDGTFARVMLSVIAGGDHFVVWESFYNPKVGSPHLEASPDQQSRPR